ncbi:MAG: alpha/beta hydrolase [Bacteroidota bacterium]
MLIDLAHNYVRSRYRRSGIQSKYCPAGSSIVHYYEYAHQDPRATVVLLHGLGTSSSTWAKVLPKLTRDYRVVAVDLAGFGFSRITSGKTYFTIGEQVEMFSQFVDALSLSSFRLIGQSFGGWIAARYAVGNQDRVEQLVLINNAGIYYKGVERVRELFTINSPRDVNRLTDAMWHRYPWYYRLLAPFILADMARRSVKDIIASIEDRDFLVEELTSLRMPVSVIWGERDKLLSKESVQTMQRIVPRLETHYLSRAGHVPQLECPGEFTKILLQVLERRLDGVD